MRKADYKNRFEPERTLDPFELCNSFLKDLDEEEQALLKDVINSIQERAF